MILIKDPIPRLQPWFWATIFFLHGLDDGIGQHKLQVSVGMIEGASVYVTSAHGTVASHTSPIHRRTTYL